MQAKNIVCWGATVCLALSVAACGQRHGETVSQQPSNSSSAPAVAPAPLTKPAPTMRSPASEPMARFSQTGNSVTLYGFADVAIAPQQQMREQYAQFSGNPIKRSTQEPVSTLSLDVDTGAYSNVRRFIQQGQLPPTDAVRVEELINYFSYDYGQARTEHPFALSTEVAPAPWNADKLLLRVGVKAVERNSIDMPPANLVFLVDVSGSMEARDKLPLVQASLKLLVEQLRPQDKVSLVVYAGRTAVELEPTSGSDKHKILAAISRLTAGGATAGASALELAYQQARAGYIPGGINRVLLATDGDFNVGVTSTEQIKKMVERQRASGISLTTLGFGQGNYNEALMKQVAQVGNGNYSYIDSLQEGRKVLVEELSATFNTVAADVKLQLEFNPDTVAEWRLIGYENRLLNEADFRNDQVDAVEIGAGKSVTALYEITLVGQPGSLPERRYAANQPQAAVVADVQRQHEGELGELRIRYKRPGHTSAVELTEVIAAKTTAQTSAQASSDWRFAAAVAAFGQQLRGTSYLGEWRYADTAALARSALGSDAQGYRRSFVQLVELAQALQTPVSAGSAQQ
ncbi:vWA domain-containing protein [Lampropedia aestuarii]|uniref:vWA domain-containing protein n=1 Tax=Lampropedia aestuarii TaxID=2562762 RepID=UPI002469466C|nr:VWA domain-containing protein [Lampropedia aestuarii]MDH5856702.1 VWA domain-containing protein [Lampropedia aestuarii]